MAFRTLFRICAGVTSAGFLTFGTAVFAQSTPVINYTGQGFNFDGTTYNLNDERCGLEGQGSANDGGTGQFSNWSGGAAYATGQGYLVWILTANGATGATLTLPEGPVSMIPVGGTFKYATRYYSYETIANVVTATYTGSVKGKVQLTVSHGCQPYEKEGAWCSPGYWRNAENAAWTLVGANRTSTLFNGNVSTAFYGANLSSDQLLSTVLSSPRTYSGAPTAGTAPRTDPTQGGTALNAFNATGAYLTDLIPGYRFDPSLIGEETACPIDNHGNLKE